MTPVDICNKALSRLGHTESISALSDNTLAAILCNRFYNEARESLLKLYPWNFAVKNYVALTEVTTESDDTFEYVYEYPADCLRIIRLGTEDDAGEPVHNVFSVKMVKGTVLWTKRIVTDVEDARVQYIYDVQDVDSMPAEFVKALSLMLATDLAAPLSSSAQLSAGVSQQASMAVDIAKRLCALEQRIPQPTTNRYADARR